MTKTQKISNGILTVLTLFVLANMIYNILRNAKFWETSFINILEMLILLFVSYYLVHLENVERRKKEKIDAIITKIQGKLLDEKLIQLGDENNQLITKVKLMSISNLIECLRSMNYKKVEPIIVLICEKMENLSALIQDHISDEEYIIKSYPEIQRLILGIDDKLEEIHLELV